MTKTDTLIGVSGWIIAAVIAYLFTMSLRKSNEKESAYQDILQEMQDSIRYRRNEAGKLIASKIAAEVSRDQAKEAYGKELAQIKKTFGINASQIRSFIRAEFAAHGSGITTIRDTVFIDSVGVEVPARTFIVKDGYLSMAGKFDASSTLFYDYTYSDSVQFVSHLKKQGLFKRTKLFVEGSFRNPNSRITGLRNVQITDFKDRRFGIGPYLGWDILNWRPAAGVSVHYSLIRF